MRNINFGIDIGGSGIKGARVNLDNGEFVGESVTVATPKPATPDAVAKTVAQILRQEKWDGPVGIALPSVIRGQVARSAANIDPSWIGTNVNELFHRHLGEREVSVLNDADAAGLAEVTFGDLAAATGPVIFLTFGTGIGSAFLIDGHLFPNTELGHLLVGRHKAEHQASSAVKDREELSFKDWAQRVSAVLTEYDQLFSPSLFIVGGGISGDHEQWIPLLTVETPVIPAKLRNHAGIVGAAMAVTTHLAP